MKSSLLDIEMGNDMLPCIAFSSTGLLIGIMVAFSSDHLSRIVIPLLFALFGGSIIGFGHKLGATERKDAYVSLLSVTASCLIGLIVGVIVVQQQWLTAESKTKLPGVSAVKADTLMYTKGLELSDFQAIEQKVGQGQLSKNDAYDELVKRLSSK